MERERRCQGRWGDPNSDLQVPPPRSSRGGGCTWEPGHTGTWGSKAGRLGEGRALSGLMVIIVVIVGCFLARKWQGTVVPEKGEHKKFSRKENWVLKLRKGTWGPAIFSEEDQEAPKPKQLGQMGSGSGATS